MEEWKSVPGTAHYLVSNHGRVMNGKTGKLIAPRATKTGYLRIHLPMKHKKRKDAYIHRLVAEAFCYRPEGCNVVNHIDFNNANNNAENLEWTTQSNNILHSMDAGRYPEKQTPKTIIGEKDGIKYIFHSAHDAARATHCNERTVLRGCKTGKRSTNGFLWRKVG